MKRTPSSGMGSTMKESAFQTEPRVSESLVRHTSTSPADKAKVTISDGKVADEEKRGEGREEECRGATSSLCANS